MASPQRTTSLLRAIDSVLRQEGVRAIPIVVANGKRFDPTILTHLRTRSDIRFFYQEEGSLPLALQMGRRQVDTEFFSNLDDDDEYLPHAVATRLQPFREDSALDVVVSNGFVEEAGRRRVSLPNITRFQSDPLLGLLEVCWLNSNGGLFRASSVGLDFFEKIPKYSEWTHLAFHLSLTKKIKFIDIQTFVNNLDTSGSLSKSKEWLFSQPRYLKSLLEYNIRPDVRRGIARKYAGLLHDISEVQIDDGQIGSAWMYHLRCLCFGGLRFFPYSRHLIARSISHLT